MNTCDECGKETNKLVFVEKKAVCDKCFPRALKQLIVKIEQSNAKLREKYEKRWSKTRKVYKRPNDKDVLK